MVVVVLFVVGGDVEVVVEPFADGVVVVVEIFVSGVDIFTEVEFVAYDVKAVVELFFSANIIFTDVEPVADDDDVVVVELFVSGVDDNFTEVELVADDFVVVVELFVSGVIIFTDVEPVANDFPNAVDVVVIGVVATVGVVVVILDKSTSVGLVKEITSLDLFDTEAFVLPMNIIVIFGEAVEFKIEFIVSVKVFSSVKLKCFDDFVLCFIPIVALSSTIVSSIPKVRLSDSLKTVFDV